MRYTSSQEVGDYGSQQLPSFAALSNIWPFRTYHVYLPSKPKIVVHLLTTKFLKDMELLLLDGVIDGVDIGFWDFVDDLHPNAPHRVK